MPRFSAGLSKQEDNQRIGVLIANLGTPDAPTTGAVRRYLKEFLWDPRIVEVPRAIWWFVLNGVILNTRPAKSAKAYKQVWTEEGSPLLTISRKQAEGVKTRLHEAFGDKVVVELGMRYGKPSIETALQRLAEKNTRKVLVLPMYPQYSATTTASITDAVYQVMAKWRVNPALRTITEYCDDEGYLAALESSVREHWAVQAPAEMLVMSFHSIPKSYSDDGDTYHQQCLRTATNIAKRLGLAEDRYKVTFQSRLGTQEWLQPYTDKTLIEMAKAGVRSVDVICPGFSADCLETIEEIEEENREYFLTNGGERYHYISALNDRTDHLDFLSSLVKKELQGWL